MTEILDHTIVSAKISHPEKPNLILVDSDGNYPTMIHDKRHGTYEGTLRKIGEGVAGIIFLSPRERLEGSSPHHVLYDTKPIEDMTKLSLPPDSEFAWRELSVK